MNFRVGWG